jgi:hypothetical protein
MPSACVICRLQRCDVLRVTRVDPGTAQERHGPRRAAGTFGEAG